MDDKKIICKCPKCGGNIVETEKAFGCENWRESDGACKTTIWKNICGVEISEEIAKQLLESKKSELVKGFTSKKTGKQFDAYLVLNDDGRVGFEFPPRN